MRLLVLVLGLFIPLTTGCGASEPTGPSRYTVSGVVTLDGKPLETGNISFQSAEDVAQGVPAGSAEIKQGQYSLITTAGEKTVKISQQVETGRDQLTDAPLMKEMIPEQFNQNSELKATVSEGENTANFDL